MKKIILIISLIIICVLLTGCGSIIDDMGERFEKIEKTKHTTFCYDKDTKAVYIVYVYGNNYGISPYIMFDSSGRPTVGQWDGTKIVPAE